MGHEDTGPVSGRVNIKNTGTIKSTYDSTRKYAQWIAEAVDADLMEAAKAKAKTLAGYDTIVFGGSLHAVGIKGVKIITDNYEALRDKNLIVFGVG